MNYIKIFVVSICITFITDSYTYAQIWLEDEAIYNEAEEFLHGNEFEEALPLYMLLKKKGLENSNINYKIGECLLNVAGNKGRAIPFLRVAVEQTSPEVKDVYSEQQAPLEAYLLLGIAYRINHQFDLAIKEFNKFKEFAVGTQDATLADYHISQCETAKVMTSNPFSSTVKAIEDNKRHHRYNPVVVNGNTIFYMEKRPFYDAVMEGELHENGLSELRNLSPEIKSDGDHILIGASADGTQLLFRAYQAGQGYELYYSNKDAKQKWSSLKKFESPVNTVFNETFASITADQRVIYFCSNRTGGNGGTDIYYAERTAANQWGEPVNLGEKINSGFNESSVFVNDDNSVLYFSSEGHLNVGSNDFFVSFKSENGEWSSPINLGSPVSTPDDDIFMSPTSDKRVFYSFRMESKDSDRNKLHKIILDEKAYDEKVLVKGQVKFDENMTKKIVAVTVSGNADSLSLSTDEEGVYSCVLTPGQYDLDFKYNESVSAHQSVFIDSNTVFSKLNLESPNWVRSTEDSDELEEEAKEIRVVAIKDVLFGFNKSRISEEYFELLDEIFEVTNNEPEIRIEITGHTDAQGGFVYNMSLSKKRANAVKGYFINKGLDSSRVLCVGKGEEYPIAINVNSDGSDNASGRQYNRRVSIDLIYSGIDIEVKKIEAVPGELLLK